MTIFDYKVRDRKGDIVTGTLEGEDIQAVAARLRQMGLTPVDVKQHGTGLKREIVLRPGHVDLKDLAVVEMKPEMLGRDMNMLLAPVKVSA